MKAKYLKKILYSVLGICIFFGGLLYIVLVRAYGWDFYRMDVSYYDAIPKYPNAEYTEPDPKTFPGTVSCKSEPSEVIGGKQFSSCQTIQFQFSTKDSIEDVNNFFTTELRNDDWAIFEETDPEIKNQKHDLKMSYYKGMTSVSIMLDRHGDKTDGYIFPFENPY
jgi:hypothetical protein